MFVPAVCWIPTWSPWISRRSWLEQKGRGVVLRRVVVLPAIGPLPCRQGHNPLVGYSAVTGCVSWGFARCSNFHQVPIFPIWALVALLWFWLWNWLRHMDAWGIWTAFGFSCSNDLAFWCALSNIRHYIEMYSCLACVIFHCKKLKEEIHIWCWDNLDFLVVGSFMFFRKPGCQMVSRMQQYVHVCSSMTCVVQGPAVISVTGNKHTAVCPTFSIQYTTEYYVVEGRRSLHVGVYDIRLIYIYIILYIYICTITLYKYMHTHTVQVCPCLFLFFS